MPRQQDPSIPPERRVRFHPPETPASGEARARIRFDVGGRPAGELRENPNTGGSRWIVSSIDADLSAVTVGREEAFGLGRTCREVESAAAEGAGGDPSLAREEARRRAAQEAPPPSPVRFRAPEDDRHGWSKIGVEVEGRPAGHLRETPADWRDGSQWIMYSRQQGLDRIGSGKPCGLGEACRLVERAALAQVPPERRASARESMAARARAATAERASPERGR